MLPVLLLGAALAAVQPASCWGDLGHRTVAYLAEKYFTDQASALVDSLLSNDQGWDISDAATWADKVRRQRPETADWHFIDAQDDPPRHCGVVFNRDCNGNTKPGCVVSAITAMTPRVTDAENDTVQQKEALMFLLHFIGDIHQPLHTEKMSRGGNEIDVCFDRRCGTEDNHNRVNLHEVWDTEIPHKHNGLKHNAKADEEKQAASAWADSLHSQNEAKGMTTTASECDDINTAQKCALQWAIEANSWNCEYVVKELTDDDLGGAYYEGAVPIVDELIGKAGLRLGAWVNALAAARSSQASFVVQKNAEDL